MEIDASSINVHEGDDVSITCDGACVGKNYNPYLRWYGPDRHWIASQEPSDRWVIFFQKNVDDLKFRIDLQTFRPHYHLVP